MSGSVHEANLIFVLIDRDAIYLSRIVNRLERLLCGPLISATTWDIQLAGQLALKASSGLKCGIILADASTCKKARADPQLAAAFVVEEWRELALANPDRPYRLMPSKQLADWLQSRAAEISREHRPSSVTVRQDNGAEQSPDVPGVSDSLGVLRASPRITVAFDMGWSGHRTWLRQQMMVTVSSGREVYYLPLMPTYQMRLVQPPGHGPNLTTLVLRLTNGEVLSTDELGHYLEFHRDGYWQFRPPERADDLIHAELPALRELVSLLRRKIETTRMGFCKEPSETDECASMPWGVIDCSGLPLQTMTALAVVADEFAVHFEPGATWADQAGQRELATMLARLPSSCTIIEMHDRK